MLTNRQRKELLERANHQSELLIYDEERGWYPAHYCHDPLCPHLECHHIEPQRVGTSLGKYREERDDPRNILVLPKCVHVGVCPSRKIDGHEKYIMPDDDRYVAHRDITFAYREYDGKTEYTSFDLVFDVRDDMLRAGEIYWDDTWDDEMLRVATENSMQCGWKFHLVGELT